VLFAKKYFACKDSTCAINGFSMPKRKITKPACVLKRRCRMNLKLLKELSAFRKPVSTSAFLYAGWPTFDMQLQL
jgi:hypothetical protein